MQLVNEAFSHAFSKTLPRAEVEMCMPFVVKGYVDFYSSEEHATNVGKMVRDPENPLTPNWKHIPIGYNGRASGVVGSLPLASATT